MVTMGAFLAMTAAAAASLLIHFRFLCVLGAVASFVAAAVRSVDEVVFFSPVEAAAVLSSAALLVVVALLGESEDDEGDEEAPAAAASVAAASVVAAFVKAEPAAFIS